jgi:hypothetical protein
MPHSSIVINKRQPQPIPPSLLQTNSLLMPDQQMLSNAATLGITNTWSLAFWAKLEWDGVGVQRLLFIQPTSTANNGIFATTSGNFNVNDLSITVNGEVGTRQSKIWENVVQGETDTWVHYVITFGGDAGTGANGLKLYTQGIDRGAADTVSVDLAGTAVDTLVRRVGLATGSFGQHWHGPVYSYGIYDTVLSAEAVAQMYNNGNARDFDLDNDFGAYTSSANLIHYFRLGIGTTEVDFGLDRTDTVPNQDMDAVGGWTVADLTTDIPTGESFITQTKSLMFDGTFDMATPVANFDTVGITNTVSWSIWAKYEKAVPAGETGLLYISPNYAGGFRANVFDFKADSGSDTDMVGGTLNNGTSFVIGRTWNDVIEGNLDTWVHYVVTFGGDNGTGANSMLLYANGVLESANIVSPDITPSTYMDNSRGIKVGDVPTGAIWEGPIYSVALYDTVLTQAQITAMYNSGNAVDMDLQTDSGNYTATANLIHYFRLGLGSQEISFGLDRAAVGSNLSLKHIAGTAPDGSDLTTDVPDGT